MSLKDDFEAAQKAAKALPSRPSNDDLLQLYAFFKQANTGDCTGKRPGMMDFAGQAKYDAWKKKAGTGRDDAMQAYVDLVKKLGA